MYIINITLLLNFMKTTLTKWGNSLAIRIPQSFLEQLEMKESQKIEIKLEKDSIILKKSGPTLANLLSKITPENIHKETDTGIPVGKEIW